MKTDQINSGPPHRAKALAKAHVSNAWHLTHSMDGSVTLDTHDDVHNETPQIGIVWNGTCSLQALYLWKQQFVWALVFVSHGLLWTMIDNC